MKKAIPLFLASCLVLGGVSLSQAQEKTPKGPPKVLAIGREVIKPGKGAAHEKVEANWPRLLANAKYETHYLAATAMTGEPRALFLAGFDSFADWEKSNQAFEKLAPAVKAEDAKLSEQDGELLSEARGAVAIYQKELSYRPDINIGQMRYVAVEVEHVRPGHAHDYQEATKMIIAAHEKANVDEHWAAYEIIAGAPGGTYIYFYPFKSLAQWDEYPTTHGKAFREAVGEEGFKKLREMESAGLVSTEINLFIFNPKMSYVSEEIAAANPDFWRPKLIPAAKPVPRTKKEAKQPAAQ